MDTLTLAIEQDIARNLERAAELYEVVIKTDTAPLEAFINLACLYWDSVDPGALRTKAFFDIASTRMYEVLNEAESQLGKVAEIEFWRLYFDWTILDGLDPFERALALVEGETTNVPYFYIFTASGYQEKYKRLARELYDEARQQLTTKNRYIISYLDSAFLNPQH